MLQESVLSAPDQGQARLSPSPSRRIGFGSGCEEYQPWPPSVRMSQLGMNQLRATVIIPFHRNLDQLEQSLPAARRSLPAAEIIVVADGAVEDASGLATASGARLIRIT